MRTLRLFVYLSIMLSIYSAGADQTSYAVLPQGESHIVMTNAKSNVQVVVKTHEVQIGKPSDPIPEVTDSNCTYSKYPCSVVDSLKITVNGKQIPIPRSAFTDLADLNLGNIEATKSGWTLTFFGGDASESFIVKIEFDASGVNKRTIFSGMSPTKPLEQTIYYDLVIE